MAAGAERADLGHFRRAEALGEGELQVVGDLLAAKDENRVLLEGGADGCVSGIVIGHIGERDAAQFSGKARTHRDDFHRHPPSVFGEVSAK